MSYSAAIMLLTILVNIHPPTQQNAHVRVLDRLMGLLEECGFRDDSDDASQYRNFRVNGVGGLTKPATTNWISAKLNLLTAPSAAPLSLEGGRVRLLVPSTYAKAASKKRPRRSAVVGDGAAAAAEDPKHFSGGHFRVFTVGMNDLQIARMDDWHLEGNSIVFPSLLTAKKCQVLC